MKQTKRLFSLLFAAILAMTLVPVSALADPATATSGRLDSPTEDTGTITVNNAKKNETYKFWRMLVLVSFRDSNPATSAHPRAEDVSDTNYETYSYAISENSDWFTFLTTYGPDSTAFDGTQSQTPYAVYTDEGNEARKNAAYFLMDKQTSTTTLANGTQFTYHVIKANRAESFTNDWDTSDSKSSRIDEEGNPAADATDYSTDRTNSDTSTTNYNKVQDFAQAAIAYATSENIEPDYTKVSPATGSSSISIPSAPLGYYLMGTSMGALASLDSTNRNVDIFEKNDEPAIDKKVLTKGSTVGLITPEYLTSTEDAGAVWVENTDADINDLVQFKTVITAQQGADSYVLHDVMETGFEFVNAENAPSGTSADNYEGTGNGYKFTPKVYFVKNNTVYEVLETAQVPKGNNNSETATNWAVKSGNGVSDGCDFEIEFKDADSSLDRNNEYAVVFGARAIYRDGSEVTDEYPQWVEITDGDKIVVTYWARVKPEAAIWGSEKSVDTAAAVSVNESGEPEVTIDGQPKTDYNASGRNDNHTILTYGDKSYTASFKSASVTTYGFDIVKTTEATQTGHYDLIDNAEFSIYKVADEAEAKDGENLKTGYASFKPMNSDYTVYYNTAKKLSFVENATDDGQSDVLGSDYTGTHTLYRYAGDNPESGGSTTTTVKSKDGKAIHVYGLEGTAFVIVEDKAPSGYNKLAHPVVVTLIKSETAAANGTTEGNLYTHFHPNDNTTTHDDQNITWKSTISVGTSPNPNYYIEAQNGGAHIVNQSGKELPSTGGMGTTIFYVVGGVLVVGAAVLFVTKRRMHTEA